MKFGMRWFGAQDDPIPLEYIRQVPNVTHVVGALFDVPVGEVWPMDKIIALRDQIEGVGLKFELVESVNIHDDIKIGGPKRDWAIDNYIATIKNLSAVGIKVICYNFMPVFDWLRTDLWHPLPDGSTALYFEKSIVDRLTPEKLIADMEANSGGLTLPGWEPERLAGFSELNEAYAGVTHDDMYRCYKYFLDAVIPTCEQYDVKLGVHPDDPPFDLFGWPRVVSTMEDLGTVLALNDSPYNGLTLCLGSFSANPTQAPRAVEAVQTYLDRIHFSHVRNVKHDANGDFSEVAHRACEGDVDTVGIMKAYAEAGYTGYIRPDHGRHLWNENTTNKPRPGYGLYDRALGIQYLLGVWDAINYRR